MTEPAASFDAVTKVYRRGPFDPRPVTALDGVTLQIPAGSAFALLGPNRAGKTTLIKLLLGLARPTKGTVTRLGRPTSIRATLGRCGYVHENPAFPRYWDARRLLLFYAAASLAGPEAAGRVSGLLERVGLADRTTEPVSTFSKGMLQRLAIAQALLNEPDLLILDEPAEGLDLIGRELLRTVLADQKRRGKTAILVTHHAAEAEHSCDASAVIVGGRIADQGPPSRAGRPLEDRLRQLYRTAAP